MKIKMLNENKLKIMFDYTELEENNISIHSFLSTPIENQKFFTTILEIANKDLGFNYKKLPLLYETISFNNKYFIVFVSKDDSISIYNNTISNHLFYCFANIDEVFNFCNILNFLFPEIEFNSSMYKYNDLFFIKLDLNKFDNILKRKLIFLISEFKNEINFEKLCIARFEEFSETLIEKNAVSILNNYKNIF